MTLHIDERMLESLSGFLQEILGDRWQLDQELDANTSLIYDLGFESIELVLLIDQLQQRFPELSIVELFEAHAGEGPPDVRLHDLAALLSGSSAPEPR
jgi:aryl carrier-like protein